MMLRVVIIASVLSACGGARLDGRADTIGELITRARDNGAQRCAPVELAMAESHHDFALQDMDEGNFYRAQDELEVARTNAREAIRKSPKSRCAPDVVVERPEPEEEAVVTAVDTDGDGLTDDVDECPERPEDKDGFKDEDGCPDEDNDNDGLADDIDDCPLEPEDIDGFEDEDGCPDTDNDGDGLADKIDKCPDEAEDEDGFEDDDGCPDCDNDEDGVPECPKVVDECPDEYAETDDGCPEEYELVVVTDEKIELKQTVFFDFNKATIKKRSYKLLNEVAKALTDHPDIHVRVEGHTDSRGSTDYNRDLSQRRAESVQDYLIRQGIDESRMTAKGYGETRPIADNRTKAGRDQNRRVEFTITRR